MVLSKINTAIAEYKKWLKTTKNHPFVYKWESVQHFQNHWDLETADPVAMFEGAFYNSETRRLWQAENWQPKRIMIEFWRFDPLTVRLMFDDLFNETKAVEGRVSRFIFGCDTLLRDYRKAKSTSIENNHDHGDFQMIALYLTFRYPESYAPYDLSIFQKTMTRFEARDIPQSNDLARYFKVLRTLMTFLEKDTEVNFLLQKHLHPKKHFQGKSLLLAEDFCRFAAG
ncbi:MAG: hypothetical protein ACKV1O_00650 [Saprospiraceae bacterium]